MTEQMAHTDEQKARGAKLPWYLKHRKPLQNLGIAAVVVVALAVTYAYVGNRKFEWKDAYSRTSDQPMDYYLLAEALKQMYGSSRVSFFSGTLDQLTEQIKEPSLIVYVKSIWEPDEETSVAFWDMLMENGSSALIATNSATDLFTYGQPSSFSSLNVSYFEHNRSYVPRPEVLSLLEAHLSTSQERYRFPRGFNNQYLSRINLNKVSPAQWKVEVLGTLTSEDANIADTPNPYSTDPKRTEWVNFVKFTPIKQPKTTVYFHANPLYLSNYGLVTPEYVEYAKEVLAHLPDLPVIWIDILVSGNARPPVEPGNKGRQLLVFILNAEALTWALYVGCGLLAMYVFSNVRRRQKAIPVVAPPANSTASYARTLGLLMEETTTSEMVGYKMANAFLAHIRKKYHISTDLPDDEFCQQLALKSGREEGEVRALITKTRLLATGNTIGVGEDDLIRYQKQILAFR